MARDKDIYKYLDIYGRATRYFGRATQSGSRERSQARRKRLDDWIAEI